jgi:pimeloyl-[acyl-carrier protein] methyl ester esterase
MLRIIVFPGMHGTTDLIADFAAAAPSDVNVELAALPQEKVDYPALASHFESTLRLSSDSVLVAESFSGPIAIMLAERINVAALILCNTFAKAPYPGVLRVLPLSLIARIPPPSFAVRFFAVGSDAPTQLVERVRATIASVPSELLAFRSRCALTVDVSSQLSRCASPILYLRGTADRLVREKSVEEIVAVAPSVSVARIPGPHLVLTTAPRESWRSITDFLLRVKPGNTGKV